MATAQADMTATQKDMTAARERISTIQNQSGNVRSIMFSKCTTIRANEVCNHLYFTTWIIYHVK
jgi:hypothetical protein